MERDWMLGKVHSVSIARQGGYKYPCEDADEREYLIVVLKGAICIRWEDRVIYVRQGESVYIASGIFRTTEYLEAENEVRVFWFSRIGEPLESPVCVYPRNAAVISVLESEPFQGAGGLRDLFVLCEIWDCLMGAITKESGLQGAVRYIERHYREDHSVGEYAAVACMSESHFRKRFSELMGMGPVAYRSTLRLRYAKELIREGYTTAEAAEAAGFHSTSFYCRLASRENKNKKL